jgi:hypothetical protein
MSNTSKTHKSRKTEVSPKPRRSPLPGKAAPADISGSPLGITPAVSPSSDVPRDAPAATTAGSPSELPKELPREQQSWYRAPDSKLRPQSAKIAVMRAAGAPVFDIAKRLKTSEANVRFVEYIARKNGWYNEDDEPVDVEAELAFDIDRKIVRNISASLDGQMTNWQTHEMTVQAAKGRGIFKSGESKPEGPQMQVVAIQVVMPPIGVVDQQVVEENTGGTPAYLEGDIQDVNELEPGLLGGATQEGNALSLQPQSARVSGSGNLGEALSGERGVSR